jgi:hypothetical protein
MLFLARRKNQQELSRMKIFFVEILPLRMDLGTSYPLPLPLGITL